MDVDTVFSSIIMVCTGAFQKLGDGFAEAKNMTLTIQEAIQKDQGLLDDAVRLVEEISALQQQKEQALWLRSTSFECHARLLIVLLCCCLLITACFDTFCLGQVVD